MLRSYWSVKKYGNRSYEASWPSIDLAATGPGAWNTPDTPNHGYDQVVIRGDVDSGKFIAFWAPRRGRLLAGMNVNTWDVADAIAALIRTRRPSTPAGSPSPGHRWRHFSSPDHRSTHPHGRPACVKPPDDRAGPSTTDPGRRGRRGETHGRIQKLIATHLVSGEMTPGQEIAIRIDQTLTQDATRTMVMLELEALARRAKTEFRSNTSTTTCCKPTSKTPKPRLPTKRMQTIRDVVSRRRGYPSRPHAAVRIPGRTMVGSDSHTGRRLALELAIGAGGLEVAPAIAGEPYYVQMPEVGVSG